MADGDGVRIVGRKPSPRGLVITDDDEFYDAVAAMLPTVKRVRFVNEVREDEWDVVVATREVDTREPWERAADHLYIITIGAQNLGTCPRTDISGSIELWFKDDSRATEFAVPETLPPLLRPLVERDLVPTVQKRDGQTVVTPSPPGGLPVADYASLLDTTEPRSLAGLFRRGGGGGYWLALPGDVSRPVEWVKAGLQVFRQIDADRFAQVPGWEERPGWLSASEQDLSKRIADVVHERDRYLRDVNTRLTTLGADLNAVRAHADTGVRRLLTAQGDDLVGATVHALEGLGFHVKPMDPEVAPNDKLEDLRLTIPENDRWEALVEVRGYSGGAKLYDLMRTQRFRDRYRDATGRAPDAVWYIANQHAGQDPDVRQPVLSTQEDELREWADVNAGLAIDTTDLFRLTVDVERGAVGQAEARGLLVGSSGRFTYASADDEDDDAP